MKSASVGHTSNEPKVSRRFTIITVMFLSVFLGLLAYTIVTLQRDKSTAFLIDIAGRQRMLLQKHVNEVFLTSQGVPTDYVSTRNLMQSTLTALMEGGELVVNQETDQRKTVSAAPSQEIFEKLREQQKHLEHIFQSTDQFLLLSPDQPEFRPQLQTLRTQHSLAIRTADEAVKQLDDYSEATITTMIEWEVLIAIIVGLLGIFVTTKSVRDSRKLEKEVGERKRAESALRVSEVFLNSIVENIPNMIFVKTAKDLRFVRLNKAAEVLLDLSRKDLIGKTDYEVFPKEQADFFSAKDREVLAGKNLVDISQEPIQTKSKGLRYLHTKKIPLLDAQGHPQYLLGISEDVTERKLAEETVRATEELYRQIMDSISDLIFVKDQSLRILWGNKAFRSFYNMTNEELKGILDSPINEPDFTKQYNEDDSYVFNTGKILDIPEEPVTRHDGQVHLFHTIKAPLYSESGEVVKLVGVARNITERKQAELERAEGELLLRLIFETGPGCIKRVAADGTLLHMNPAGLQLIEAEQETEALGLSVYDLIVPEHVGAFQQMHHKVMQGTKQTLQFEIQGLRGGRRWMETYVAPFHNPITKTVEHLAVTHDITERKKAEEVFRRGERKFRAIYEQAPNGIAILDSHSGQFTQINQKYCDITGYSQEEMRDRTFQELTHPDDLQADLDYMQQLLTDQITNFQMEKRYIRKNGEIIWVNLTCVPLWLGPSDHRQHIAMVEDITYRKQAEKALQESEERYRTLYEDNPSMYFTVAQDGKILSVNQFGAQQLGYSVEELIGLPVIDLFLEDDQSQVQQHFESSLRKPLTVLSWEYRKVRKDRSVLWVEESARAVYSKEGEIVVLIVCEDISERKESEKALQEWKTLTESVLGQLPKGFAYRCLNNKNWTAVYVSHGIEEVTGFPASALLNGKINYNSLLAPGENERVWANVQEALAQHLPYENEHQIITSDGTTKWILARGRFIFDDAGQLLYLDGLNVDITEQKQIEKALRTSEARFRSLIEHVPFGIHEIELSGKISSMNKSGQHMMGIENESQVIGHSYLKFTEEKDHDRIRDFFEQALQGQPVDFELNETTHGKLRYFTKSFVPIRGREGTVLKIVGISEEITERKEAEKQLLDSEAKRIDALRQSDELKSALLASVSHELRTPLTAMKGSVSSIIGNSSVSKDQKREEALKGIDREINYMSHLVDNLLDMSQIEAGTLIPHKEWHLLEDLMEGALRRAAQTLDTRNIAIDIPENVPPIFVDAVEIQQVLMNLIDNAVKYSSPHSPIQLLARIDPQQIEVMVSNTGEPIQAQDLERIFERFYRRRSPREEPIRGTGLGLAICKGIIEAHGGRIWAESVGKEVIITFTIPTTESMADFSLEGLHKR